MCEELENALETQEVLGAEMTKGASLAFKAAIKSMRKQGEEMKHMAQDFKRHVEESEQKLHDLAEDVKSIKSSVESFQADATKWQLILQILKALFGDTKRCVLTTVWVALILGAVHFSEIIELLKAMV